MQVQHRLIEAIRQKLPPHIALEHALAKATGVSMTTAFEWVRGQQALPLDHAMTLAQAHGIDWNSLSANGGAAGTIPFQFMGFNYNVTQLEDYFYRILHQFKQVDVFGARKMVYVASELPLFTLFQFPELAAFKLFFWGKTVYHLPHFEHQQYDRRFLSDDLMMLGEAAWEAYLKFYSTELWSSNIINDLLTQIYAFWQHRIFKHKGDALRICDKVIQLLDHVEMQARIGKKFHPRRKLPDTPNFELYYNDVAISNNTIWVQTPSQQATFVSQNALNYLVTDHPTFCMHTEAWARRLQQNSIKISQGNDKLRHHFFEQMRENIAFIKHEIQAAR